MASLESSYALPWAFYITVNPKDALLPKQLKNKGLAIREDIAKVMDFPILCRH